MKRKAYIVSAAHISAQKPFCGIEEFVPLTWKEALVPCQDPDFRPFIPPMAVRRMSSILKRSIAVSKYVLEKAGISCPDAIVGGTGMGCVTDTEAFLRKMLEDGEYMLNPSRFICSTPNTIGSQIAINLGCRGFNSTHVNDRFAFEGALLESLLLLWNGEEENVLLCAADQMPLALYDLVNREGLWKGRPASEGAESFVLSSKRENAACEVIDVAQTRSNPSHELSRLLSSNNIDVSQIDLYVTSDFPSGKADHFSFLPQERMTYKQYCGDFYTASAFGLFVCSELIRTEKAKTILLAGESHGTYSFTLIGSLCTN